MSDERMRQFRCDPNFFPYLQQVFERLPLDVLRNEIIDDGALQVLSLGANCYGRYLHLPEPAEYIIILNEAILNLPEMDIIHTIAHELAHKVAKGGRTGLREKEAENLLTDWGFDEESKAAQYALPIIEDDGYRIGWEWAAKQEDLSAFAAYYDAWNEGSLSSLQFTRLRELINSQGVLREDGCEEGLNLETDVFIRMLLDQERFDTAVIYGIMGALKTERHLEVEELKERKRMEGAEIRAKLEQEGVFAECDWCGAKIRYGNACLTIEENIEQIQWGAEVSNVNVIEADSLLTLCASCGNRLSIETVTDLLGNAPENLSTESDEIYTNCGRCGVPIHYGSTYMILSRMIQQANYEPEDDTVFVTVISAEVVRTFCRTCGALFDSEGFTEALKSCRPTKRPIEAGIAAA